MEEELRYYYGFDKYETLIEKLKKYNELKYDGCFYELTTQYDHPCIEDSFYNKKIDGRFRVRCSKNIKTKQSKSKISWKKRTNNTSNGLVNKEEEVEVNFQFEEFDKLVFLLENVIKKKTMTQQKAMTKRPPKKARLLQQANPQKSPPATALMIPPKRQRR